MAYINGTFQYFDNSFLWDRTDYAKPTKVTYAPSTLFGFLQEHHPKWLLVLQRADKEHLFQFQPNSSFTMFVPTEESLSDAMVVNMDKSTAIAMFEYHTLRGAYDKSVLETSRFQHLNTLIDGQPIYYFSTPNGKGILNRSQTILEYNISFASVILHIISGPLFTIGSGCSQ
jgi:hypothetical protein